MCHFVKYDTDNVLLLHNIMNAALILVNNGWRHILINPDLEWANTLALALSEYEFNAHWECVLILTHHAILCKTVHTQYGNVEYVLVLPSNND